MIKVHKSYSLDLSPEQTFFTKRVYEPMGRAPMFSIPQWNHCLIARLLHGAWLMNALSRPENGGTIDFNAPEGHRFLEWELRDGEAVCFDFRKLVGFSSTVRLEMVVSLRLTAFSMNRLFYHVAVGPGKLLLETGGVPNVFYTAAEAKSFPPSRLICWSADSVFGLEANSGTMDHYFSAAYLKALETRGLVIDADDLKETSGGFLTKLVKRMYGVG